MSGKLHWRLYTAGRQGRGKWNRTLGKFGQGVDMNQQIKVGLRVNEVWMKSGISSPEVNIEAVPRGSGIKDGFYPCRWKGTDKL